MASWALFLCLGASEVFAAGGGKPATKLVNVADTRAMASGFSKWVADTYNTNLWLYGIIVVVLMASLGLVLGTVFDRILGLLGIHLGKLEHHE
jgi:hypothetical protein